MWGEGLGQFSRGSAKFVADSLGITQHDGYWVDDGVVTHTKKYLHVSDIEKLMPCNEYLKIL